MLMSGPNNWARYTISCFEADPCPVVVADLALADLNGYELCRQIRARQQSEYVYVILVVPPGKPFQYQLALDVEADDVLCAPIDADILRARLHVAERMLHLYEELDRLSGLIPICAYCKKIRQKQGLWQQMEAYITEHSHALFTHTICPECVEKEFGQDLRDRKRSKNFYPTHCEGVLAMPGRAG